MGRPMWMLTLAAVVALVAVSGALAQQMKTEEAIDARQKLMKEQGAAMKSIQDKLKASDTNIAAEAQKLVETSKRIPALFPEGSLDPSTSRAKPEIWQKPSEFEGNARSLNQKATALEASAKSGADVRALAAAATNIGRTTCAACHDAFRGPEIKK